MIASEGGERVETLYADQYAWPLGGALLLLIVDAFLGEAPRRRRRVASHEIVAAVGEGRFLTSRPERGGVHAR